MNLQISKWGNSLAVRIPAEFIRQIPLKDGDQVEATLSLDGSLHLRPIAFERTALSAELKRVRASMPMGSSVIEELRSKARY
ncbi:MazE Growth regulator [Burkholderiaceae bacterium]|jgi:antitoxin MazE